MSSNPPSQSLDYLLAYLSLEQVIAATTIRRKRLFRKRKNRIGPLRGCEMETNHIRFALVPQAIRQIVDGHGSRRAHIGERVLRFFYGRMIWPHVAMGADCAMGPLGFWIDYPHPQNL